MYFKDEIPIFPGREGFGEKMQKTGYFPKMSEFVLENNNCTAAILLKQVSTLLKSFDRFCQNRSPTVATESGISKMSPTASRFLSTIW